MAGVYTRRLAAMRVMHDVAQDLYEAPGDGTVVIRDFLFSNSSGTSMNAVQLYVRPLVKTGQFWLWIALDVPPGSFRVDMRQVLDPRETLVVQSSQADYSVAVTGYVFSS